jgi:putative transcriptional regulator
VTGPRHRAGVLLIGALLLATVAQGAEPRGAAGKLLVATEQMSDPRFVRAVIYMIEDDAGGALGVIVNRPMAQVTTAELLRDMRRDARGAQGTVRVHYGGPVGGGQAFVLHSEEWRAADTSVVGDGMAVTRSALVLEAMARGMGPRRTLFVVGYAGWAPHQLEAELAADVWITVTSDEGIVFDEDASSKWERAMARRKIVL